MTRKQFELAILLAKNKDVDLSGVVTEHLWGCGLPEFEPVWCNYTEVAAMIRWQCHYICVPKGTPPEGEWDQKELQNLWHIAKVKFMVPNSEELLYRTSVIALKGGHP